MTFRGRLVLATTAAVLVVVVLGSVATYLVAYNSLIGATDASLSGQAQAYIGNPNIQTIFNTCATTAGECIQIVYPDGSTVSADGAASIPINDTVRMVAASRGQAPAVYQSTTVNGVDAREVVAALPLGFQYHGNVFEEMGEGGALQIGTPLTGINQELRHLAVALWIIIIGGVAIAIVLGLAVGRTALRPLNSLTETVEELAETTDVSQRLDSGGCLLYTSDAADE